MAQKSVLKKQKESVGVGNLILQVGVIGSAGSEEYLKDWKPPQGMLSAVKKIGELLGKKGATIVTGGGGIMSAVAREGIKRDSITIGLFNTHNDIGVGDIYTVGITTGMFEGGPEYFLPLCSDIMIAISGGAGTLNELTVAYRNRVPVVLLKGYGGWVDRLIPQLHEGKYLDERQRTPFYIVDSPEKAVATAIKEGEKRLKKIVKEGKEFYRKEMKLRTGVRKIS
ncbi:MAG: hypothetical protein HQ530_03755 [Parcubacteria group bacterium]|nr:hypothetical protein [Parcubacteria group bacterium]